MVASNFYTPKKETNTKIKHSLNETNFLNDTKKPEFFKSYNH